MARLNTLRLYNNLKTTMDADAAQKISEAVGDLARRSLGIDSKFGWCADTVDHILGERLNRRFTRINGVARIKSAQSA